VGGAVLALSGGFALGLGIAEGEGGQTRLSHGLELGGALGFVTGTVGLCVGIPYWAVGVHRTREARRRGFWPSARPFVLPTREGALAGITIGAF
jgi:hypothetical protein